LEAEIKTKIRKETRIKIRVARTREPLLLTARPVQA